MARIPFNLPDIGEGVTQAEIVEWHVKAGDPVVEGQPVATVMTDKANVELEAPATGIVTERLGEVGAIIAVGQLLVAIETDAGAAEPVASGELAPPPIQEPLPPSQVSDGGPSGPEARPGPAARPGKVLASPAVRKRAKALGVDLAAVFPGRDQIHHSDLDAYLLGEKRGVQASSVTGPQEREIPVRGLRRQIALKMAESHQHIPAFTHVEEIDVTDLMALRQNLNAMRRDRPVLHLLPFFTIAVRRAITEFPMLNAHHDDEKDIITEFAQLRLGIAMQTASGLIVPVIPVLESMDLWDIAGEIERLAAKARSGSLSKSDLSGATMTITSLGKRAGVMSTPIVPRPQVAILAPNRVFERLVWRNCRPEPRQVMNLSISCDHRVVDGYHAASFLAAIKRLLEAPSLLFMDA